MARSELPCAAISVTLPEPQIRHDLVVPVRQRPDQHVLQALGPRPGLGRQGRVPRVVEVRVRIVRCRSAAAAVSYERRQSMNCPRRTPARVAALSCPAERRSAARSAARTAWSRSKAGLRCPARSARCGSLRRSTEVWTDVRQQTVLDQQLATTGRLAPHPLALRSTSTQPVNRFLAFHSLSPVPQQDQGGSHVASLVARRPHALAPALGPRERSRPACIAARWH